MSLVNSQGKVTELKPLIRMAFFKEKKVITLTEENNGSDPSSELYFTRNDSQVNSKLATMIMSKDDFIAFAKYIGGLKCLKGEFVEENNSCYIWRFKNYTRGKRNFLVPGCSSSFDLDPGTISFLCPNGLRYQFPAPFIRNITDYDNTLLISTHFFDCIHQKPKQSKSEDSNLRIFI